MIKILSGRKRVQWNLIGVVTVFAIGVALTSCSQPAESANNVKVSPEFEQQVLQVMRNHPEVIIESVQAYQKKQQDDLQQARQSFLQQMKTNPKVVIGNSPTTGATEQKVVLVEFSDFQCPFCSRAHETLKQFMAKHKDRVTLVYKHFPLNDIHPEAIPAAKAAWAAQQQGKFWEYQDALFSQQKQLGEALYGTIAQNLKLDIEKFNRDRKSEAAETAIQQDTQLAMSLGISGTPFFILNGETFSGAVELSEMEAILARVSP